MPSPGDRFLENRHLPSGSEQYEIVRSTTSSTTTSRPSFSAAPHHGQFANWKGVPPPPCSYLPLGPFLTTRRYSAPEFGVERPPTQSPIRNGSIPHLADPSSMARR